MRGRDVVGHPLARDVDVLAVLPQCIRLLDEALSIGATPRNAHNAVAAHDLCDVLRVRRDDQEEEIIDDERVPTSLYLSASRSQSRSLLRAESIRVSILANILSGEHGVPDGYIYSF